MVLGPRWFSKRSVLMMHILADILAIRSVGIRFKNLCEFWSSLGRGSGGAPWRNEGPMMQGRRLRRPPRGKPGPWFRGLPDLRADTVPPTPKKKGVEAAAIWHMSHWSTNIGAMHVAG